VHRDVGRNIQVFRPPPRVFSDLRGQAHQQGQERRGRHFDGMSRRGERNRNMFSDGGEDVYVEPGKQHRLRVPGGHRGGLLALAMPALAFAAFGMGLAVAQSQLTREPFADGSRTAAPACLTSAYTGFCQFSRVKRRGFDFHPCMRFSPASAWKSALTAAAAEDDLEDDKPAASKVGEYWPFLKRVPEMKHRYGWASEGQRDLLDRDESPFHCTSPPYDPSARLLFFFLPLS